jgi:hypothetical protein
MSYIRLTGALAAALIGLTHPVMAAGFNEEQDWQFGSTTRTFQNQILMEQLRQQKIGGQFNAPLTNLQVENNSVTQNSTTVGNLNQVTVTGSSGVTVTSGQTNKNSTQNAQSGIGAAQGSDLNGTLVLKPVSGQ